MSLQVKRLIVKLWTIDVLLAVLTYIAYRIAIMHTTATGDGFSATILYILDILLNLGFSLLYLAAMVVCSFTIFLTFSKKIRNSYFLSWLSFSGAPILLVLINLLMDSHLYNGGVTTKLMIFSLLYISSSTVLFLKFREIIVKTKGI
jgi:hypothetical protein